MNLLDRYFKGETVQVYDDIQGLGKLAFEPAYYPTVEAVLTETFERVSQNLDIIHAELLSRNYAFTKEIQYDFQKPIARPTNDVDQLLTKLDKLVGRVGFVPLSLKMFYRVVGSCNFAWDYENNPKIPWEGADPLQVSPLQDLVSELEDLEEREDDEFPQLCISADYLHKDNISGGPPYGVEITRERSIDGLFLDEEHDITFIKYLRLSMEHGGFSRGEDCISIKEFMDFRQTVKPKLLLI